MEFVKNAKVFLLLFYICGFSPYAPTKHNLQLFTTYTRKIPTLFQVLVGLYLTSICAYNLLICMWNTTIKDRTNFFITSLFILCQMARIILATIQCIFYKTIYYRVINTLNFLEGYFAVHLQHRIKFKLFTNGVVKKMLLATVGFMQLIIMKILDTHPVDFYVTIIQMTSILTSCHLVFYIDLLSFHLEQLLVVIVRDSTTNHNTVDIMFYKYSANCVFVRNQLKLYKTVHFTLWEINQCINKFFGWTMVAIFLQTFVDFLYCSYCLFEEFQDTLVLVKLIRMKIFPFIIISNFRHFALLLEPISLFVNILIGTLTLVNSCHELLQKVSGISITKIIFRCQYYIFQKCRIIKHLEKFIFYANENNWLHAAKHEILAQLAHFTITVKAKGFFEIDRRFLAAVRNEHYKMYINLYNFFKNN